ncbi:hypothetical protein [Pseudomonas sp. 3A(2025)]
MDKIKIRLITLGSPPVNFQRRKLKEWKSSIFEITGEIESFDLNCKSDGHQWDYSDKTLEPEIPSISSEHFLIAIVNFPIEENWYTRRLKNNRILFSFHEIKDILTSSNIPLENAILRLIYAQTLLYKRNGNRIPTNAENTDYTHDDTRGCIYDLNGIKTEIINSCHKPVICPSCVATIKREKISIELLKKYQSEIIKIRKDLFYRITDFIKQHPLWSLLISSLTAICLGAIGSILASYIYDSTKPATSTSHQEPGIALEKPSPDQTRLTTKIQQHP